MRIQAVKVHAAIATTAQFANYMHACMWGAGRLMLTTNAPMQVSGCL